MCIMPNIYLDKVENNTSKFNLTNLKCTFFSPYRNGSDLIRTLSLPVAIPIKFALSALENGLITLATAFEILVEAVKTLFSLTFLILNLFTLPSEKDVSKMCDNILYNSNAVKRACESTLVGLFTTICDSLHALSGPIIGIACIVGRAIATITDKMTNNETHEELTAASPMYL